jgi:hypothetical protein
LKPSRHSAHSGPARLSWHSPARNKVSVLPAEGGREQGTCAALGAVRGQQAAVHLTRLVVLAPVAWRKGLEPGMRRSLGTERKWS